VLKLLVRNKQMVVEMRAKRGSDRLQLWSLVRESSEEEEWYGSEGKQRGGRVVRRRGVEARVRAWRW
jgi:hypothetical protein